MKNMVKIFSGGIIMLIFLVTVTNTYQYYETVHKKTSEFNSKSLSSIDKKILFERVNNDNEALIVLGNYLFNRIDDKDFNKLANIIVKNNISFNEAISFIFYFGEFNDFNLDEQSYLSNQMIKKQYPYFNHDYCNFTEDAHNIDFIKKLHSNLSSFFPPYQCPDISVKNYKFPNKTY